MINESGIEIEGTILRYESGNKGHKTPIIQYKTIEGQEIEKQPYFYTSTDLSIIRSYKENINKTVRLKYISQNPEKFILTEENSVNYVA